MIKWIEFVGRGALLNLIVMLSTDVEVFPIIHRVIILILIILWFLNPLLPLKHYKQTKKTKPKQSED